MRAIVIDRLRTGSMTIAKAAETIGVCPRQIHRLRSKANMDGLSAVLPQKRKVPAHNKFSKVKVERIIEILHNELVGYAPKLAAEVLTEEYKLPISREAVRKIMIQVGLWQPHGRAGKGKTRIHSPRKRRSRFGELVLGDTSFHEWIDGLGNLGLVVMIDDATSQILNLSFTHSETTAAYMQCFEAYALKFGLPECFFADRHKALFRLRSDWQGEGLRFETEFARALADLGVVPIPSFTPQGRGRVERAHRTLKDRLTKFLKRRAANNIELATALLPEFISV